MSEIGEKRTARWYETVYVVVLLALLAVSLFFMNTHRVGVMDVNRVAKAVGMDTRIVEDARQMQQAANVRAARLQQNFTERMADLDKQLKAATTDDDRDRVRSDMKSAEGLYQQTLAGIRGNLAQHEALVLRSFRARLQPAIDQVARRHRLDLVMDAGANVFYVRGNVDVTDRVIARCEGLFPKEAPLIDPAVTAKVGVVERPLDAVKGASETP
jgi:Skp family chaperone for outer membrane proteins